ncbi:hypothetical protein SPFL3102_01250 [Sporomusaceae bacterium FL31]|nr:hypothetical protein SPFL3101_00141 [Sporomusaceae bacterium FL31]GCE33443.1 hypothetical protein SPFL3102_01250 [Sporomusaceae bacterium]
MAPQKNGFMMIGVLIATMIIGLAFVAYLNLSILGTKATNIAADYTVAANLAQKQLELLKTQDKNFWVTHIIDSNIPWQDTAQTNPVNINNTDYLITTSSEVSEEDNQLAKVTVTVQWHEQENDHLLQFIMLYDTNP